MAGSRRTRFRAPDGRQPLLIKTTTTELPQAPIADTHFDNGDRSTLFFGDDRLDVYLERTGERMALELAKLVDELDVSSLTADYSVLGRSPVHPKIMFGLYVYGLINATSSLRALEGLARRDLGAMWICRGLQPDHSAIGRFLVRHGESIVDKMFDECIRMLARRLNVKAVDAAIDGTVIEAASSRLRALRAEAARQIAQEARQEADAAKRRADVAARSPASAASGEAVDAQPGDGRAGGDDTGARASVDGLQRAAVQAEQCAQHAERVAQLVEERASARDARDGKGDTVRIAPSDPDAVMQPRKDGVVRPAYKPSIIASPERLIVAQTVEASSEPAAVAPLLDQYRANLGADPQTLMADAAYRSVALAALYVERGLDALVSDGRWATKAKKVGALFDKSDFRYDEVRDAYVCPVDRLLRPKRRQTNRHGQRLRQYEGEKCGDCPRRIECTKSKNGPRHIQRFEGEENVEALDQVMKQPAARMKHRKRQAIVEPVFGALRERLGLKRFRRRGLTRVRIEFTMYCVAYNLKRAIEIRAAAVSRGGPDGSRSTVFAILIVLIAS